MPTFPVFDHAVFGPARTNLMGQALDRAIGLFKIAPSRPAKEAMANRIIEAAHLGVSDVNGLADAALSGTGVVR